MTDFERRVYEGLLEIPDGFVTTYGQLAELIGCPRAARAVGNALHKNPLPDVYPCYKVVNSNGGLARNFGFGGMDEQKRRLEKSGVKVENYTVDLEDYLYKH